MSKIGPKEATLRAQREARVADNELKSMSAQPKRSKQSQKKIKAAIDAAAKSKSKGR